MLREPGERRPRPRIESLADLIFGLSLSIGSIALIANSPTNPGEINGHILAEPYLPAGINMGPPIRKQVIPPGEYFLMGDNRDDSTDSRVFGPISRHLIVGRAFILIWPIPDFGLL